MDTLLVASGEDDGAGLISDEALGDLRLAQVSGGRSPLLKDSLRSQDLDC